MAPPFCCLVVVGIIITRLTQRAEIIGAPPTTDPRPVATELPRVRVVRIKPKLLVERGGAHASAVRWRRRMVASACAPALELE